MNIGRIGIGLFFIASALVMGLFELEVTPPLWWEEGWTLCVARQWVETGHYGCLLNGQPAPPILAGHFPVVASIAAGFRLFGVQNLLDGVGHRLGGHGADFASGLQQGIERRLILLPGIKLKRPR